MESLGKILRDGVSEFSFEIGVLGLGSFRLSAWDPFMVQLAGNCFNGARIILELLWTPGLVFWSSGFTWEYERTGPQTLSPERFVLRVGFGFRVSMDFNGSLRLLDTY